MNEADISRATFYLHYGTKEELLFKSLETRFDQLVQKIEADVLNHPDRPLQMWCLQPKLSRGSIWADGFIDSAET